MEQHLDKLAYTVKAILVRPPDVAARATAGGTSSTGQEFGTRRATMLGIRLHG